MAEAFRWSGDGLAPGPLTTASAGAGDTAPSAVVGSGTGSIVIAGERPPCIQISGTSAGNRYARWSFASQAQGGGRFYFTPSDLATSGNVLYFLRVESGGVARITLDSTVTGRFNLRDESSLLQQGPSGTITPGETYRVEWSITSAGAISVVIYVGESTTPHVSLSGTTASGSHDAVMLGHITGGAGYVGTLGFDDILVTDTASLPGPVPPPEPTGTTRARGGRLVGSVPEGSSVARGGRLLGSLPDTFAVTIASTDDLARAEPGTTVTLTASATGGTVTAWTWSAPPGITITPDGNECAVYVPATLYGQNINITATATGTGASAGSATAVVQALPHNEWITSPTGWQPLLSSLL